MPDSTILDLLLLLLLLAFLVNGYRSGFVQSLSGIAGIIAGGAVAFFLVPMIGPWMKL
jgi:uncharacterized membrane protein required for colicin V production